MAGKLSASNSMNREPFYDPTRSYEENYTQGPFGVFADGIVYEDKGEPAYEILGQKVYAPIGIPAGPLLNSRFIKGAFGKGFDFAVYKTVRSDAFPCYPFPNVLAVHVRGDLTLEKAQVEPLVADANYQDPISITNSFGVPSKPASVWQKDVELALSYERPGRITILSFMGTVREGQAQKEFIEDYVLAAKLAAQTGAKILEVNLSCPNIGNEGLVCYNLDMTEEICHAIRSVIGVTPLILKVGYYNDDEQLHRLAVIADRYAQGISCINTIQATVVDREGKQALPGEKRLRSGVCGVAIKWAGLDMVKRLKILRATENMDYVICGVGGVMTAQDYHEYRQAGADIVMSATGAMWNPHLAIEIKKSLYLSEA